MLNKVRLNITHKILLLVSILSGLAGLITLYSLNNLNMVDNNYRYLLDYKTQNALIISDALLNLSDASRLAFSVLTVQEEKAMRITQTNLAEQQFIFLKKLSRISSLTDQQVITLNDIKVKQEEVFNLINNVIEAAANWRGDRALIIINTQLEPSLAELRLSMDQLRESIINDYLHTTQKLTETSQNTIFNTALAVGLTLTLAISLASYLSVTRISRPITRLTYVMSRLSDRYYDEPIPYHQRDDEVGRMAQALQVFRDNMQRADRLELEAANSAENKRLSKQLRTLTDAMPGLVFQLRLDKNGSKQFLFLNSKAHDFLGQDSTTLLNYIFPAHESVFPGSTTFQWIINKALHNAKQSLLPIDTDIRIERNGQIFWYKILATCQPSKLQSTLFNGILLDVTAMKQQAQALEEAKNIAEQAARSKATFLTTMSHEIRTPMNAILCLAQIALRHNLSPDQKQRLEKINSAGSHLLSIINDILDFSKLDGNHLQLEHINFSPNLLVSETVKMLSDDAKEKNLSIHIDTDPHLPNYLQGDPTRIGQILLNYLNNAIKFSESGSIYIRLRLQHDIHNKSQLYAEIEDQGIGISTDNAANLFQEFQQADASITRRFGGTGLGLAISKKLALLMHGDVGVNSRIGQGSTFWFTAAVSVDNLEISHEQSIENDLSRTSPEHFNNLTVLIVDDNELNRLVGQELLEEAGFNVDLAHNGKQAINQIKAHKSGHYSAVLMDIMMPVMDGISATKKIRTLPQGLNLPIIAVSANTQNKDIQHYLAAGLDAYISKPINEKTLWATLSHFIKKNQCNTLLTDSSAKQLNQQHLLSLRNSIPNERFLKLLKMLIEDYKKHLSHIKKTNLPLDIISLQKSLHDLISTAGHAGFLQLSKQALEFNNALYTYNDLLHPSTDEPIFNKTPNTYQKKHLAELQKNIILELNNAINYLQLQINDLQPST